MHVLKLEGNALKYSQLIASNIFLTIASMFLLCGEHLQFFMTI